MRVFAFTSGIIICCGIALGDTFHFSGSPNATWKNEANWETPNGDPASRYPQAGDRAVISLAKTVDVKAGDSMTRDTVDVVGKILIVGSGTLTLKNHHCGLVPACSLFNSIVDGEIEIQDQGGVLAFTTRDHTISGNGMITSQALNDEFEIGATIEIAAGITFRNELNHWVPGAFEFGGIRGALNIVGLSGTNDGKFINDGVVEAIMDVEQGGILVVDADFDDTPEGRWIVNCPTRITFFRAANLEGDFEDVGSFVDSSDLGGDFKFVDVIVSTCGTWDRSGCGGIQIAGDGEFRYLIYIGAQGCPSAPDDGNGISGPCGDLKQVVNGVAGNLDCTAG